MAQVIEHLPRKHKVLNSNPSTKGKEKYFNGSIITQLQNNLPSKDY
jgi:hypothetical protein